MLVQLFSLLFILAAGLIQAELPLIGLDRLEVTAKEYDRKAIRVRGFLYQDLQGRVILALQPNLKSCCTGSRSNIHQQMVVQSEDVLAISKEATELEGILRVNPKYDSEGQVIQLYVLDQARIVPSQQLTWGPYIGAGAVIACLLLWRIRRKQLNMLKRSSK